MDSRSSSVLSSAISCNTFNSSFSASTAGGVSVASLARHRGSTAEIVLDGETNSTVSSFVNLRPLHSLSRLRVLYELNARNSSTSPSSPSSPASTFASRTSQSPKMMMERGAAAGALPPNPAMDRILYQSGGAGIGGSSDESAAAGANRGRSPGQNSGSSSPATSPVRLPAALMAAAAAAASPGAKRKDEKSAAAHQAWLEARPGRLRRVTDWYLFKTGQERIRQQKEREQQQASSPSISAAASPLSASVSTSGGGGFPSGSDGGGGPKSAATIRKELMQKASAKSRKDAAGHIVHFPALRKVFRIAPRQSACNELGGLALLSLVCAEHGDAVVAAAALRLAPGGIRNSMQQGLAEQACSWTTADTVLDWSSRQSAFLGAVSFESSLHAAAKTALVESAKRKAEEQQERKRELDAAGGNTVTAKMMATARRQRSATVAVTSSAGRPQFGSDSLSPSASPVASAVFSPMSSTLPTRPDGSVDVVAAAFQQQQLHQRGTFSSPSSSSSSSSAAAAAAKDNEQIDAKRDIFGFGLTEKQQQRKTAETICADAAEHNEFIRTHVPGRGGGAPQRAYSSSPPSAAAGSGGGTRHNVNFCFKSSTANCFHTPDHELGLAQHPHSSSSPSPSSSPTTAGYRNQLNQSLPHSLHEQRQLLAAAANTHDCDETHMDRVGFRDPVANPERAIHKRFLDMLLGSDNSSSSSSNVERESVAEAILATADNSDYLQRLYKKQCKSDVQKHYVLLCAIFGMNPNKTLLLKQLSKFNSALEINAFSLNGNLIGDKGLLPLLEMSRSRHDGELCCSSLSSSSSSSCSCVPLPNLTEIDLQSNGVTDVGAEYLAEWLLHRFLVAAPDASSSGGETTLRPCSYFRRFEDGSVGTVPQFRINLNGNADIGIGGALALIRALEIIRRVCSNTRWWKMMESDGGSFFSENGDEDHDDDDDDEDFASADGDSIMGLVAQHSMLMVSPSSAGLLKANLDKNPFSMQEMMKNLSNPASFRQMLRRQASSAHYGSAGGNNNTNNNSSSNNMMMNSPADEQQQKEAQRVTEFLRELTDDRTNFFSLAPQRMMSTRALSRQRSTLFNPVVVPSSQQVVKDTSEAASPASPSMSSPPSSPEHQQQQQQQQWQSSAADFIDAVARREDSVEVGESEATLSRAGSGKTARPTFLEAPSFSMDSAPMLSSPMSPARFVFIFVDCRACSVPPGLVRRIVDLGTI